MGPQAVGRFPAQLALLLLSYRSTLASTSSSLRMLLLTCHSADGFLPLIPTAYALCSEIASGLESTRNGSRRAVKGAAKDDGNGDHASAAGGAPQLILHGLLLPAKGATGRTDFSCERSVLKCRGKSLSSRSLRLRAEAVPRLSRRPASGPLPSDASRPAFRHVVDSRLQRARPENRCSGEIILRQQSLTRFGWATQG